jgi:Rha family phage regulatory protein
METNLVKIENGQPVTSSRKVAQDFERLHKNVLVNVEEIIGVAEKSADLFFKTTYTHPQNKQQYPEYLMNRDGFTLLAMSFKGAKAIKWKMKYIAAFNEMEQQLATLDQPSYQIEDKIKRAEKWIVEARELMDTQLQLHETKQQLTEAKPKADFVDKYVDKGITYSIRQTAKILNIPERQFVDILMTSKIVFRQSGCIMPYANKQSEGYFEVKVGYNYGWQYDQTRFTTKGIYWIAKRLKDIADPNWESKLRIA